MRFLALPYIPYTTRLIKLSKDLQMIQKHTLVEAKSSHIPYTTRLTKLSKDLQMTQISGTLYVPKKTKMKNSNLRWLQNFYDIFKIAQTSSKTWQYQAQLANSWAVARILHQLVGELLTNNHVPKNQHNICVVIDLLLNIQHSCITKEHNKTCSDSYYVCSRR